MHKVPPAQLPFFPSPRIIANVASVYQRKILIFWLTDFYFRILTLNFYPSKLFPPARPMFFSGGESEARLRLHIQLVPPPPYHPPADEKKWRLVSII